MLKFISVVSFVLSQLIYYQQCPGFLSHQHNRCIMLLCHIIIIHAYVMLYMAIT